ncbi:MAG TPA: hypothetical protein VFY90_11950 [Tepidiformaceae bacterium]|nr:hypothetical protein [Tepidiformaceae bacterium]
MRHTSGLLIGAALAALAPVVGASAQLPPHIPGTYYGSATIDGERPPSGTAVRAFIDGVDCTQPGAMGTIDAEYAGAYVIDVMHETQQPGCGREGKRVTFTIGGREAGQSAEWSQGLQALNLNAGSGEPRPLPPNVPRPINASAAQGEASASSPGGAAGGTLTPLPPGLSREEEDGGGINVGAFLVIALGAVAIGGAAGGWLLSRRRRAPGESGD